MQVNYWYDDKNGSIYYLGNDGKYLKDTIKEIDGSLYAFDTFGKMVKNSPYVSSEEGYYFGNDAKADKTEGYKNFADTYCYVKDDGKLLINSWKEDDGKWYYFNENGLMQRNSFIDEIYYVDENGEMVKNKEIKIGNDTYTFDSDGKSKMKARKISKNINWIVKSPLNSSYNNTTIINDYNTKDSSKMIKSNFNGEEQNVSISVGFGGISFKIYLSDRAKIKPMGYKSYEASMVTETGQNIKIWYSAPSEDELSWGVTLNGNEDRERSYSQLIDLLCKTEDTKYTIQFPNSKLSIKSEICPGNFSQKYAPYRDKIIW